MQSKEDFETVRYNLCRIKTADNLSKLIFITPRYSKAAADLLRGIRGSTDREKFPDVRHQSNLHTEWISPVLPTSFSIHTTYDGPNVCATLLTDTRRIWSNKHCRFYDFMIKILRHVVQRIRRSEKIVSNFKSVQPCVYYSFATSG